MGDLLMFLIQLSSHANCYKFLNLTNNMVMPKPIIPWIKDIKIKAVDIIDREFTI